MGLSDLTDRSAVLQALAEYDQLGREAFLARYGFGPARSYFLVHNGKRYDSKAIAGIAIGKQFPTSGPLAHSDFSGGEATVQAKLESLGFQVSSNKPDSGTHPRSGISALGSSLGPSVSPSSRNPDWMRDELILALDLYVRFGGRSPDKASSEISELSGLLNRLSGAIGSAADYRNNNGVYMKLMNFRRFDPVYQAQGKSGLSRGNKLEEVIWKEFASDPSRLAQTANAIRANISEPNEQTLLPMEIDEAEEGRVLTRAHLVRERSRRLVEAKKRETLHSGGCLACEACGFDFKATYGDRGDGFIEAHHAVPLHELLPGTKTRLADLHLLCANCHRMVHSRRPWLTFDQLRNCLKSPCVRGLTAKGIGRDSVEKNGDKRNA
jgi:5-methylcytosine-specific restriction protein A